MTVRERMLTLRLLQKLSQFPDLAESLQIENPEESSDPDDSDKPPICICSKTAGIPPTGEIPAIFLPLY